MKPHPENTELGVQPGRGEKLVALWLVAIFYGASSIWSVISLGLILAGRVPLNGLQQRYFDSLSLVSISLSVLGGIVFVAASVVLMLRMKEAAHLFIAGLVIGCANFLYSLTATTWLNVFGLGAAVGTVVGFGLTLIVIQFTSHLGKIEILK